MKKLFVRTGLLLAIPLLFSTCHKVDWKHVFGSHGNDDCQVQAYYLSGYEFRDYPFLFEKKFNHAGMVSEINCTYNNIVLEEDRIHHNLRVVYNDDEVYLINKANATDTTLKVFLNAWGRVRECIGTGDFVFHNKFFYKNNRLLMIEAITAENVFRDTCIYDDRGNLLSLTKVETFNGLRAGYFFQYDYSRKAKQQFYFDEIRDLNNDFALLIYLGCFPELSPVNVRTHARDGLEVGSMTYDKDLINHRFDKKGRLVGYDVVSPGSGELYYKARVVWRCR